MKKQIIQLGLVLAVGALLVGCKGSGQGSKAGSGEAVAKVGDTSITLQEFEEQLNQQNPLIRARYNSPDQKKKFLDSLVEREAMVLEAKRLGLDKDPEVIQGYEKILARYVENKEFNQKLAKEITIPDADIEKYYQENIARYRSPEKAMIHLISFAAPANKAAERTTAKQNSANALKQLKATPQDRRVFFELMRKFSGEEAAKNQSNNMAFKTKEEMEQTYGKVVANGAFSLLQANDLSPILEDEKGFYIVRLAGKQAALDVPLEKAKSQIQSILMGKAKSDAYQAFVEGIKNKVGVKVFDDVLAKAKVDMSQSPSSGPGGLMPDGAAPNQPIQIQPQLQPQQPSGMRALKPGEPMQLPKLNAAPPIRTQPRPGGESKPGKP